MGVILVNWQTAESPGFEWRGVVCYGTSSVLNSYIDTSVLLPEKDAWFVARVNP